MRTSWPRRQVTRTWDSPRRSERVEGPARVVLRQGVAHLHDRRGRRLGELADVSVHENGTAVVFRGVGEHGVETWATVRAKGCGCGGR